jgi:hypothetical protein
MIESRLSRFVKREVVVAPHAPPDGRCPSGMSFAATLLFPWPIQHCQHWHHLENRLDGNRTARAGR